MMTTKLEKQEMKTNYPAQRTSKEVTRLRRQHELVKQAFGGHLVYVPIQPAISHAIDPSNPKLRILDSGTADRHWLIDLAPQLSPTTRFYGTDIEPRQFPTKAELPYDVALQVQSIREPWPKEWQDSFDLVHQRAALAVAAGNELQLVVKRLAEMVKPAAGWLQLVDGDLSDVGQDASRPALTQFQGLWANFMTYFRFRLSPGKGLEELLMKAGMVDVQERVVTVSDWKRSRHGGRCAPVGPGIYRGLRWS